jgi:hypothetical protein
VVSRSQFSTSHPPCNFLWAHPPSPGKLQFDRTDCTVQLPIAVSRCITHCHPVSLQHDMIVYIRATALLLISDHLQHRGMEILMYPAAELHFSHEYHLLCSITSLQHDCSKFPRADLLDVSHRQLAMQQQVAGLYCHQQEMIASCQNECWQQLNCMFDSRMHCCNPTQCITCHVICTCISSRSTQRILMQL